MTTFAERRRRMVEQDLAKRGIRDAHVLAAMLEVPREQFVPPDLAEFAYNDSPLPIAEDQTISQPFIVALMTEALELAPGERVLEVGTGSGYAAAVLSRTAGEVFTVERHRFLAGQAQARLSQVGYRNVHVLHADGTEGWPEHAPYDAIVVAAGGPRVPEALLGQLAPGGRLVIPVGDTPREQSLLRVRNDPVRGFEQEDLGPVRFVPLIGVEGWSPPEPSEAPRDLSDSDAVELVRTCAEPLSTIKGADLGGFLERVGDTRVVLLGEATHGTAEFYQMRAELTKALIKNRGFKVIAVEADWPDARQVDAHSKSEPAAPPEWHAFARFPTWMWRNQEVGDFVTWLRDHNEGQPPEERVSFYGLDLYSLHRSIAQVIDYLEQVDPAAARVAAVRYGCLTPWEHDPAAYGHAVLSGVYESCEPDVVANLVDLFERRAAYVGADGARFFNAEQNARVAKNAEQYYRVMYRGGPASWNLRDSHMFETLSEILDHHGDDTKVVIWEHNSHIGDARATEMGARGEHNVGQLCRQAFGDAAYLVGFGTDHGTVAAADEWGGPVRLKRVRPSHPQSHESVFHQSGIEAFFMALREPGHDELIPAFAQPRLERAIGVIYRPETELQSHYFQAALSHQFDEYIWFDETQAVQPLTVAAEAGVPDTFPFGV